MALRWPRAFRQPDPQEDRRGAEALVPVFINTTTYAPSAAASAARSDDADEGPIRPAPRAGLRSSSRPAGARRAGGPAYRLLCGACFRPASRRGRIYEHGDLARLTSLGAAPSISRRSERAGLRDGE